MKENILTKDLIDPKNFRIILLIFFGVYSLFILGMGINQIIEVNIFVDARALDSQETLGEKSLEIWDLKITNTQVRDYSNSSQKPEWKMYVSVLNLDYQTPSPLRVEILSAKSNQNRKFYGVEGHPSFILKQEDVSFWKWHFYLKTILVFGGLLIISVIYLLIYETKYRNSKLFITPIKNFILSLAIFLMAGMYIKWGLDFWLFNFLNDQFYLGEQTPPIDATLLYISFPILILGAWLEQAVRLQKEQDLTI